MHALLCLLLAEDVFRSAYDAVSLAELEEGEEEAKFSEGTSKA